MVGRIDWGGGWPAGMELNGVWQNRALQYRLAAGSICRVWRVGWDETEQNSTEWRSGSVYDLCRRAGGVRYPDM